MRPGHESLEILIVGNFRIKSGVHSFLSPPPPPHPILGLSCNRSTIIISIASRRSEIIIVIIIIILFQREREREPPLDRRLMIISILLAATPRRHLSLPLPLYAQVHRRPWRYAGPPRRHCAQGCRGRHCMPGVAMQNGAITEERKKAIEMRCN